LWLITEAKDLAPSASSADAIVHVMRKPSANAGLWTVADINEGLLRPMWRPADPGRQR
jgi:hypothetical protein